MAQGKEKALIGGIPTKAQVNKAVTDYLGKSPTGGRLNDQDMTRIMNMLRGMVSPKAASRKKNVKKGMAQGGKAMTKKKMMGGGKVMPKKKMMYGGKAKKK